MIHLRLYLLSLRPSWCVATRLFLRFGMIGSMSRLTNSARAALLS